jgi:uncharacterized membrane protein YbhN (UPF0104 family)
MQVDGREIAVSGSLLLPLTRRTNDLLRVVLTALFLAIVIAGSVVARAKWGSVEKSISEFVGVLTPDQSNLVYLLYGVAILALPFVILVGLVVTRRWKLLGAYAAAGLMAALALSISSNGISALGWHFTLSDRLNTTVSQFVDDPRWIAMITAMVTVVGPWLPARLRRTWWVLLLAFGPIHLVVSGVVPARSLLGLAVGWFVGALVVWVVGTPALEVPVAGAIRALGQRGLLVSGLTVVSPAGSGPLVLSATSTPPDSTAIIELYGPNQRSGGALHQLWQRIRLRSSETPSLQASMHRAVEHRALMAIAFGALDLANTSPIAVAELERGWMMYAHTPDRGRPIDQCVPAIPIARVWKSLRLLHDHQISHGDLRSSQITVDCGSVRFGGFGGAEYGATDVQLQSDIAQLLVLTTAVYDAHSAVSAAITHFGKDPVLSAASRLAKSTLPQQLRKSVHDGGAAISAARDQVMRQAGADQIHTETITRVTRKQVIQLVLLIGLVYVAYPYISSAPSFLSAIGTANRQWVVLGAALSALTYVGAASALWACAEKVASFRKLVLLQYACTLAATATPAGLGGLALSARFLQQSGLSTVRATAAVAMQQAVQIITHVVLLIIFSAAAGAAADLSHFVPSATELYLVAGLALGLLGPFLLVPALRRWLQSAVRPRLREVMDALAGLIHEPQRLALIVFGCATTSLGNAGVLWVSVLAFGGDTPFVAVAIVTMIGGSLASSAPTPGGVGAVEAALIGGLAAFGLPATIGVPAVLLYRVLTCWVPALIGSPVMRWMATNELI